MHGVLMATPIVYNGIKFPFQKGGTSFPRAATDDELIKDSLVQLILTMNGERIMRPEFGSNALTFIFENNDDVLGNLLRAEIQGVVARYEPRIQITDIGVGQRDSEIIITISYIVLATGRASLAVVGVPIP
jgi:phage baseplate assembly protein W